MTNYINRFANLFGIRVISLNSSKNILKNVYKSSFTKNVLISYIKEPFLSDEFNYSHSNFMECKAAGDIFNELGFNVDVIDLLDENRDIDYSKYEVVYGLGFALEHAFYSEYAEKIKKIFYSTGCNPFFSYTQSALTVQRFKEKSGLIAPQSSRVGAYFWTFQYISSDLIISLGNEFVANTYKLSNKNINIKPIHAFYFDTQKINLETKNFERAKKHYLWFGSNGLLHKGLDIVMNIFEKRKDLTLHICGAPSSEKKFFSYYNRKIESQNNIINHGFIDIRSDKFKDIINTCVGLIFPSASEGGSPSVLNVIANGGLIPIITKSTGLDLFDHSIHEDKDIELEILRIVDDLTSTDSNLLKSKAIILRDYVYRKYTYGNYKINLKKHLETILCSADEKIY